MCVCAESAAHNVKRCSLSFAGAAMVSGKEAALRAASAGAPLHSSDAEASAASMWRQP